jgi:hypothetical protein
MADYKIINTDKYIGIVFNTIEDDDVDQNFVDKFKQAFPERLCLQERNYDKHEIGFYFYK